MVKLFLGPELTSSKFNKRMACNFLFIEFNDFSAMYQLCSSYFVFFNVILICAL